MQFVLQDAEPRLGILDARAALFHGQGHGAVCGQLLAGAAQLLLRLLLEFQAPLLEPQVLGLALRAALVLAQGPAELLEACAPVARLQLLAKLPHMLLSCVGKRAQGPQLLVLGCEPCVHVAGVLHRAVQALGHVPEPLLEHGQAGIRRAGLARGRAPGRELQLPRLQCLQPRVDAQQGLLRPPLLRGQALPELGLELLHALLLSPLRLLGDGAGHADAGRNLLETLLEVRVLLAHLPLHLVPPLRQAVVHQVNSPDLSLHLLREPLDVARQLGQPQIKLQVHALGRAELLLQPCLRCLPGPVVLVPELAELAPNLLLKGFYLSANRAQHARVMRGA
mmetsp:Transcript_62796/g.178382  ORF Transcript_62796/g.178382 Transcript_62796/m.178382 type:complete len:337 (+) Transcript_62796:231-1241(+)